MSRFSDSSMRYGRRDDHDVARRMAREERDAHGDGGEDDGPEREAHG